MVSFWYVPNITDKCGKCQGVREIFLGSDRPVGETIAFRVIRFDYEVILGLFVQRGRPVLFGAIAHLNRNVSGHSIADLVTLGGGIAGNALPRGTYT